jgi:hypothetical protein
MLPTGFSNLPVVSILTTKLDQFSPWPVQKLNQLHLGEPNPDLYLHPMDSQHKVYSLGYFTNNHLIPI